MYLNHVMLIGNLGGDAEKITLNHSKVKVNLQLATQRSWKNKESGEYESRAEWHRVVVWGGLTKFAETLKKGERILVVGELRTREYEKGVGTGESKQDIPIKVTEVYASQLRRMERRKDSDEPLEPAETMPADEHSETPF